MDTARTLRFPARVRSRGKRRAGTPAGDRFIGRARELELLDDALDRACGGTPQVVLVTGEAGIGKSRSLDEFAPHAIERGARVVRGACQEDGAVSYLPIATAVGALVPDRSENPFTAAHGVDAAADFASDESRVRLFVAVSHALLARTTAQPVVLVVEDVHWIDDATLALLRHLVSFANEQATIERAPLLIAVTARPTDPASPVGTFMARAGRAHGTSAITLAELDALECRELIADFFGERPSRAAIDRLVEATGGNPLVLRSALARVRDAGVAGTEVSVADVLGVTDLDHELWRRVETLGTECRELVVHAAFLGDGGALGDLAVVAARDRAALDALLAEASEHGVLASDDEQYWFDHPQLRQLLYHAPSPDERAAVHLLIAQRLGPTQTEPVVVAHHLVLAEPLVDPERLASACNEAAERSAAVGAWRDAAKYAIAALGAAVSQGVADDERALLEYRAGRAAFLARERDAGIRYLGAAAERAEQCGAVAVWGRALLHLAREGFEGTDVQAENLANIHRLERFLDAAGADEPALRAEVHALAAELHVGLDDIAAAEVHNALADRFAADAEDDHVRVRVAFARGVQHLGAVELDRARERFEAARSFAERLDDPNPRVWCLVRLGVLAYVTGALPRAQHLLDDAIGAAREADNLADLSFATVVSVSLATAQGRVASAELDGERSYRVYREAEYWFTPSILFPSLAAARTLRGDAAAAHEALAIWESVQARRSRRYRPLVDALLGDLDAAARAVESAPFRVFTSAPRPDFFISGAMAAQVELGALIGDPALVSGPLDALVDLYDRGMRFTIGWAAFVPRVLALGYAALGQLDEAERWFAAARADAHGAGAAAEVARVALDRARVLAAQPDHDITIVGAERATARAAYTAISLHPRVPGAGALGLHATAVALHSGADIATRIVLVTDIVDSTPLNERLGDRAYLQLLREHDAIVRARLSEHDGVEFKHTGDGVAAWFFSVNNAVACASALMHDFETRALTHDDGLRIKAGIAAGESTIVEGDLIGLAVTVAFRVVGMAQRNEVLVTSDIAGLARGAQWSFDSLGRHPLKGLREPVELARLSLGTTP